MAQTTYRPAFAADGALVGGVILPQRVTASWELLSTQPATAGNHGNVFFIADRAYEVVSVKERHATAGADGGAVTGMLKKVPSGTAAGSGTDCLASGISYKGTADTNAAGTLHATAANYTLAAGDGLAMVLTGTPTSLAGVSVTVELKAV
jgi:hypothetical protein